MNNNLIIKVIIFLFIQLALFNFKYISIFAIQTIDTPNYIEGAIIIDESKVDIEEHMNGYIEIDDLFATISLIIIIIIYLKVDKYTSLKEKYNER